MGPTSIEMQYDMNYIIIFTNKYIGYLNNPVLPAGNFNAQDNSDLLTASKPYILYRFKEMHDRKYGVITDKCSFAYWKDLHLLFSHIKMGYCTVLRDKWQPNEKF